MQTRNYSFRTDIMEDIFEIRSCIEILSNDIEIYTIVQYRICSIADKKLQGIHTFKR